MQMSPIIAVHITVSLTALVIGPIAIWARLGQTKRPLLHRAIGYGWVSMMVASAVSAVFIRDYGLPNLYSARVILFEITHQEGQTIAG